MQTGNMGGIDSIQGECWPKTGKCPKPTAVHRSSPLADVKMQVCENNWVRKIVGVKKRIDK